MEKLEKQIGAIASAVNDLKTNVALTNKDVGYIRKEIEGNGKKGLIQKMDDLECKHDDDKNKMEEKVEKVDDKVDDVSGFNKKITGGLIASQVLIGIVITLIVKFG